MDRARHAIQGLLAMAPEVAAVRQADGSPGSTCRWAASAACKPMVRVRPGERVPMDGVVAAGTSAVEPGAGHRREHRRSTRPLGDAVFAGTINATGMLEVTRDCGGVELDPRTHHPRRRTSAGHARPDPRFRRPFRGRSTRPACSSSRWRWSCSGRGCFGWTCAGGGLQGAGAAGHRLPLCAGDLDTGDGGQWPGRGGAARHPASRVACTWRARAG